MALHATEEQHLRAYTQYAARRPWGPYWHHVPNERRSRAEAKRLAGQGVKAGIPDIYLDVARGGYHGLRLELKTERGRPTQAQFERLRLLRECFYYVGWVRGWEVAAYVTDWYWSWDGVPTDDAPPPGRDAWELTRR